MEKRYYYYLLFGKRIRTNFDLGLLPPSKPGRASIEIRWESQPVRKKPCRWYHQNRFEDGSLFCSFGKLGSQFFIRSHGIGDIVYSKRTKVARIYHLKKRQTLATVQSLVLNQVLPFVFSIEGYQVLHASAVAKGRQAYVLLGETGRGKSTLASAFVLKGYRLLSDDALPVLLKKTRVLAMPSFPEARLDPIAGRALLGQREYRKFQTTFRKRRVRFCERFRAKAVRIQKIFILESAQNSKRQVSFEALKPREAWLNLMQHVFRVDLFDSKRMKSEMSVLSEVAERLEFSKIYYPRNFRDLPRVIRAIEKHT